MKTQVKILIAPDKFKGTLTAQEVCESIRNGLARKSSNYHIWIHPLADGGDGSIDILAQYVEVQKHEVSTTDPLGRLIQSYYYTSDKSAFVELAKASGLSLLNDSEYNPLLTSTLGTGTIILDAISKGFKQIYLFLGGSATTDGGMGIASALGYTFTDNLKNPLSPIGQNLGQIFKIEKTAGFKHISRVNFTILCDVSNPLHGPNGASFVYAKQKGADHKMIKYLDDGLIHLEKVLKSYSGKDLTNLKGVGAAGGTPACLLGLFDSQLQSGIKTFIELTGLEEKIKSADIVISGEGKVDKQSIDGKLVKGVSDLCRSYNKPLFLFVGKNDLTKDESTALNISKVYEIMDVAEDERDALNNPKYYLERLASNVDFSKL